MIDIFPYGIGFFVYMGFCMVTFDVYSRKPEVTNTLVLYMIYLYYTILASYLINIVDSASSFGVRFVQIMIYAIACAIVLFGHYKNIIEENSDKFGKKTGSF